MGEDDSTVVVRGADTGVEVFSDLILRDRALLTVSGESSLSVLDGTLEVRDSAHVDAIAGTHVEVTGSLVFRNFATGQFTDTDVLVGNHFLLAGSSTVVISQSVVELLQGVVEISDSTQLTVLGSQLTVGGVNADILGSIIVRDQAVLIVDEASNILLPNGNIVGSGNSL